MAQTGSKWREVVLIGLVGLIALCANLPDTVMDRVSIQREYLLLALVAVIFFGMLLYLRFAVFIIIVVLVVGANLPEQWAEQLGVSAWPLIVALAVMVAVALFNQVRRSLPTGLETDSSAESCKAIFYAIDKGNDALLKRLLTLKVDPNLVDEKGNTPLMRAAMRGTDILLRAGADTNRLNQEGDSAIDLATSHGFKSVADLLKAFRMMQSDRAAATPN
jgi:hypothetical protein